jgi:hypothetical protein
VRSDRYAIDARAAGNATEDEMRAMLQSSSPTVLSSPSCAKQEHCRSTSWWLSTQVSRSRL